ncbi:SixA phosphatase family protein [Rubritalea sp.]|uniref:SixA phosphatase family protein n=1 Tax=Rubritalea sp. TaxID=2109375 RepID=UPI003EF3D19D
MRLYVIRHAKAMDYGNASSGGERALTADGQTQASRIGDYFLGNSEKPELVLTSPILRAKQTAEILCEVAKLGSAHTVDWLRCGMRPEVAVRELTAYREFERVAIVGHNPDLYFLLHHLLNEISAPEHVKKASVHVLESFDPPANSALLSEILRF